MAEKKCKYCAMMIPKEAKICPHCRKRQGWTLPAKIGLGIIVMIVIFGIIPELFGPSPSKKYTEEQKKIAQEAHDILIGGLMKEGIIKELKGEGKLQVVYVNGDLWKRILTYEQKRELLGIVLPPSNGTKNWFEIRSSLSYF